MYLKEVCGYKYYTNDKIEQGLMEKLRDFEMFDGYDVTWKVFGKYVFNLRRNPGIGWFRIFHGYGLQWRHKTTNAPFSERYGYTKRLWLHDFGFKLLKP